MDVYINREEMSDYIGITSKDLLSRDHKTNIML